jgi:hypothetical protein
MSNTTKDLQMEEIANKIIKLETVKGQTPSSLITLVIPPKYCI